MPEIEQRSEDSYRSEQYVGAVEARHKKIEIVVFVFTVLVTVAVIAFFTGKDTSPEQPFAVGECIYTNNIDTMKEAVAQASLNLCNCIDDPDTKSMCIAQVDDAIAYGVAVHNLNQDECENIRDETSKASCVLAVQDRASYIEREAPASGVGTVSTDFEKSYKENPQDVNTLVNLAMSYGTASLGDGTTQVNSEKISQAMTYLEEAKKIEPTNAKVYVAEGYLYGVQGENDKALASYTKAIQLDSKNIEAYVSRAKTYSVMNKTSEAIADLEKATQLDTSKVYADMILNIELCRLYADTGNTEKASEKCNAVVNSMGSNEAAKAEAKTILESLQ